MAKEAPPQNRAQPAWEQRVRADTPRKLSARKYLPKEQAQKCLKKPKISCISEIYFLAGKCLLL